MRFYTYVHRRSSDGAVFYVGKGCGQRAFSWKGRNPRWSHTARKHGLQVEIVAPWTSEADAFLHEQFLIACFRDIGAPLVNMTDGGEGGISTAILSDEGKARRLAGLRMAAADPAVRQRKRASSLLAGNRPPVLHGSDHPASRPVRCVEWNHVFESAQAAANWLATQQYDLASKSAIIACCRGRQGRAYEFRWEYAT